MAREIELCYASICIITNPAAGMRDDAMAATEIVEEMAKSMGRLRKIIAKATAKMPEERGCSCKDALSKARL